MYSTTVCIDESIGLSTPLSGPTVREQYCFLTAVPISTAERNIQIDRHTAHLYVPYVLCVESGPTITYTSSTTFE